MEKMFSTINMPTNITSLFSAYASLTATMMIIRSIINDLVPPTLRSYLESFLSYLFTPPSNTVTITVEDQAGMLRNQVYDAAETYLRTKLNPNTGRFKVSKTEKQKKIQLGLEKGEEIADKFEDINLKWNYVLIEKEHGYDKTYFELSFQKKYKDCVLNEYLPFVLAKAKEIKDNDRSIKLYTRDGGSYDDDDYGGYNNSWGHIKLEHPANFDTLAMEPEAKKAIIDDLDRFLRRRDFYKKVGKAWKRGYLLYGPPGTGKSSLIAAMANYLKFDIYDLELTSLYSNSELRRILVGTTNRSIMVIEDIDCSAEMRDREMGSDVPEPAHSDNKITLSGLLNFIDGLWSSCGDERIIIFTTNHKDRLDPALLRPGRMDMHIHMSYCTFNGFKLLASNYLGITDYHNLYSKIEGLMVDAQVTPASIAEELMKSEDADVALQGVVDLLERKKKENIRVEVEGVEKGKAGEVEGVEKGKTENRKKRNNRRKGRKN